MMRFPITSLPISTLSFLARIDRTDSDFRGRSKDREEHFYPAHHYLLWLRFGAVSRSRGADQ
jgi:hypothetical protein